MLVYVFVLAIGAIQSSIHREQYEAVEIRHQFIASLAFKCSYALLIVPYTVTALYPISYAIFDYPEPSRWRPTWGFRYDQCNLSHTQQQLITRVDHFDFQCSDICTHFQRIAAILCWYVHAIHSVSWYPHYTGYICIALFWSVFIHCCDGGWFTASVRWIQ